MAPILPPPFPGQTRETQDDAAVAKAVEAFVSSAIKAYLSPASASLEARKAEEPYLVWSNEHRAWWRANSQGYTASIEHAGIYTRDEALDIARTSRDGWSIHGIPDEIAVAVADIPPRARAAIRALPLTSEPQTEAEAQSKAATQ